MTIVSRIRSFLRKTDANADNVPEATFGEPSRGSIMDRSGGEMGPDLGHDAEHELIRPHDFGAPNDAIAEHVRPHVPSSDDPSQN